MLVCDGKKSKNTLYTITIFVYNIDVIQRRFWLAAMPAPYDDGARK